MCTGTPALYEQTIRERVARPRRSHLHLTAAAAAVASPVVVAAVAIVAVAEFSVWFGRVPALVPRPGALLGGGVRGGAIEHLFHRDPALHDPLVLEANREVVDAALHIRERRLVLLHIRVPLATLYFSPCARASHSFPS